MRVLSAVPAGDAIAATESGFVYFDAFKYEEAPLRREFIRNVARKLEIKDPKFDSGLYEEQTAIDINLDSKTIKSVSLTIGMIAGPILGFCLLLALLLAQLTHKGFW